MNRNNYVIGSNVDKNSTTSSPLSKNNFILGENSDKNSFTEGNNRNNYGITWYLLTDILDNILVGQNEDEILILNEATTGVNLTRHG